MTAEGARETHAPTWNLLTSHGLVLLYVAANPDATIREIADTLDFTERRIADIIRDLEQVELISVERDGRRNHYTLNHHARFIHPFVGAVPFQSFVDIWRLTRE
jgi:DNA-binding MarR family transcriptional regulator